MAATGWTCDIDVCNPGFGSSSNTPKQMPNNCIAAAAAASTAANNNNHQLPSNSTVNNTEPLSKRSRLNANSTGHGITNGFAEPPNKVSLSDNSPAARLGLTQRFRTSFDAHFQNALKEKLSTYLKRLDTTEESVSAIREELKELTGRMNHIDTSSKELKKFVTERVSLPTPTSGVGQRRTLSSQAPRLPPPPPLVSAPETTTQTNPDSAQPTALPQLTPSAVNRTGTPAVGLPGPAPVPPRPPGLANGSGSTISPSAPPFRGASVGTQNLRQALGTQKPQKPAPVPRLTDTIDLTVDTSPVVCSSAPVAAILEQTKSPNPVLPTATLQGTAVNSPLFRSQTAPAPPVFSVLTQPMVTSKPAPSLPRAACPPQTNSLLSSLAPRPPRPQPFTDSTQLSSPVDLNPLPVAPLPPIPYQPNRGGRPIQPMPLLTIAEAAEGICLQWTVANQSAMFEPATAYEIYSYASSELTRGTMYTHLPWKKVGEVTALPLPMACTLTHVQANNLYYFTVRSVDRFRRYSNWSNIVNAVVG